MTKCPKSMMRLVSMTWHALKVLCLSLVSRTEVLVISIQYGNISSSSIICTRVYIHTKRKKKQKNLGDNLIWAGLVLIQYAIWNFWHIYYFFNHMAFHTGFVVRTEEIFHLETANDTKNKHLFGSFGGKRLARCFLGFS